MVINNFIQLVLLSLLTKAQLNKASNESSIDSYGKKVDEWKYPFAPNDTYAGDTFWGQFVKDIYRPLSNPFDSKTLKYIEESNAFTNNYLDQDKSRIYTRRTLESMYNYERISQQTVVNGTTYEVYNPGSYTVGILTRRVGNGPRETLVDPREMFEKDTTQVACYGVSKNSKYLAYGLSRKGSDWQTFFVIDLKTGKQLNDKVNWGRYNGGLAWSGDEGFYYYRFQEPQGITEDQAGLENNVVNYEGYYLHKVGDNESNDVPQDNGDNESSTSSRSVHVVNDRYLLTIYEQVIPQSEGGNGGSHAKIIDLNQRGGSSRSILSGNGSNFIKYLGSDSQGMEFITSVDAKYHQLVKVKFDNLDKYEVIVKEINEQMLYNSIASGTKRVNFYYWDGISFITYTEKDGDKPKEIKIPFGNANSASFSPYGDTFTFKLASFLYIYQEFEYNFQTGKLTLKSTKKAPGFDGDQFDQYLAHYKAKDGQDIPILMAHAKGINPDKSRAGFLYGYGGFQVQQHPGYTPLWGYLMKEKDMVVSIALIRGGYERGEDWYNSAIKLTKPLSYSDFSDAVDFLHNDRKYGFVGEKKQFINGGSNGGLLVGATCNLIPEKLGGCIADVGVMDILRFATFTGGASWETDYGLPQNSKEMFETEMKYSPLQNVLPTRSAYSDKYYPPYLINTANYDDRVSPTHSLRLAATIQNNHRKSPNPALLYVAHNSGHSPSNAPKRVDGYLNAISLINLALRKY
jgi:prolyl oligopeptidase